MRSACRASNARYKGPLACYPGPVSFPSSLAVAPLVRGRAVRVSVAPDVGPGTWAEARPADEAVAALALADSLAVTRARVVAIDVANP